MQKMFKLNKAPKKRQLSRPSLRGAGRASDAVGRLCVVGSDALEAARKVESLDIISVIERLGCTIVAH
jgi:hypothetical protein